MSFGMLPRMAKKTPNPKGDSDGSRKATVLAIKGSAEWKEWLDRAARHCRVSTSALVDLALTRYVKEQGFDDPPPQR